MAKLLKDRARNPIMESAAPVGSQATVDKKLGYRLDLYPANRKERSYEVLLTREEMLTIVSSWLAGEAKHAVDKAKRLAVGGPG